MCSLRTKFLISFLVIFVIFTTKSDASCKEGKNKEFVCSSVTDVKSGGLKNDWNGLTVEGGSSKTQIEDNAFSNVPNIKKLVLSGAVNKLNTNSFKGLNKLHKLQFFDNDIQEIKSNIFANVPVKEILIYTSNVKKLKPRCFDNLPNLKEVYIHKNSISHIPAGVFSYTNLQKLFLNENGIETIEEEAFYGMRNLYKLGLERNHLKHFDSNLYIGSTSPKLEILWLARNNLTKISSDMLAPFPNLKVLLFHINNIDTIEDNSFKNNKNLRYIDLSNNKLEQLSPKILPDDGLKKLDILFLQNNHLIHLPTDTLAKLPVLTKVAIGGNPWLCPCYHQLKKILSEKEITLICDDEYLDGKRPVCVSPLVVTNKCSPENENVQSVYDFYMNGQKDYLELPPLCKVYCGNDKSCYSHDFDVLIYKD